MLRNNGAREPAKNFFLHFLLAKSAKPKIYFL